MTNWQITSSKSKRTSCVSWVNLVSNWYVLPPVRPFYVLIHDIQSMMPLLYTWLCNFAAKFDAMAGEDTVLLLAHEFVVARKTMEMMISRRLGELVQIWSQQKQHLPTQVSGFCGGIFESYYEIVRVACFSDVKDHP